MATPTTAGDHDESKRDFLTLTAGGFAAVGAAIAVWPFIDSMNPSADVLALASIEVDISAIEKGQRVTVKWRGKPVFIDHRNEEQIEKARAVKLSELIDPEADAERAEKPEWLIMVGVCTHLGCIPKGQKPSENHGEFGGWYGPCHGWHYDTSGRIRKGPAPKNLVVPPYTFVTDTQIKIG